MKKKNYIQPEVNAMNLVSEEQVMAASGPSHKFTRFRLWRRCL